MDSQDLVLDFKSATLYAVRLVLHSADPARLDEALVQHMKEAGGFFENEPVVIDASRVVEIIDWPRLLDALRRHDLPAIGVVAEGENLDAARRAGLALVDLSTPTVRQDVAGATAAVSASACANPAPPSTNAAPAAVSAIPAAESAAETTAVAPEAPAVAPKSEPEFESKLASKPEPAASAPLNAPFMPANPAMIVNRPLRSGQRVYARDTDLVVIGMVSQGAEVIADGNVHVYGPLRGKAMAGARGDTSASIFTTQLDPELLAVAGVYRVIENRLDARVHDKAARVSLDGETLKIEAISE